MNDGSCMSEFCNYNSHVFLGQCEFSFTKTQLVMDMNRREMERYEDVYRCVRVWSEGCSV